MVWLAGQDLVGTEELLEQDHAGQLMRECDRTQGQPQIGSLTHLGREAERTADHEAEVLAGRAAILEKRGQVGAGCGRALAVESTSEGGRRNALEHSLPLTFERLGPAIGSDARLPDLLHLEPGVPSQQSLVVGHVIGERRTPQPADADDHDPHECDTSPTPEPTKGAPMSDDGERERHINMHMSPEVMAGVYANFANVSHSEYEFTITFARLDHEVEDDEIPGVVVSRVSASPQFMRELIDALEDNFSKWSTREGIKNLPEYQGKGPEDGEESRSTTT
jgi:hypothetical protein